jgi:hypothetical protein
MHRVPFFTAVCLSLTLPAVAGAQAPGASSSVRQPHAQAVTTSASQDDREDPRPVCAADGDVREPDDPRWRWRLRAYRHLDCMVNLVDEALTARAGASTGEGSRRAGSVAISREDLERIRTLAWWARDAAARIGQ